MVNFWLVEKITSFVVALDAGIGLYAVELIVGLREEHPEISLTCIVPWEEQATKWTPDLRERYFNVQAQCADVETVSQARHSGSPSFIKFFTLVLGSFHCFPIYIRKRRRSHSSQLFIVLRILAM